MAQILSHPFRLGSDGRVATVEQTSDAGAAEQLAVLCLTRPGERPLVPAFGLSDPTFAGFDASELAAGVAAWGPAVDVTNVTITAAGDAVQAVEVLFR